MILIAHVLLSVSFSILLCLKSTEIRKRQTEHWTQWVAVLTTCLSHACRNHRSASMSAERSESSGIASISSFPSSDTHLQSCNVFVRSNTHNTGTPSIPRFHGIQLLVLDWASLFRRFLMYILPSPTLDQIKNREGRHRYAMHKVLYKTINLMQWNRILP